MRSTRWYSLAVLLVVAGLAAGGAWWLYALERVTDAVEDFRPVGRGREVTVETAGTHTVWAERPCAGFCPLESGDAYRRHMRIGFAPAGDEAASPVEVERHPGGGRYNVGQGRDGRAVWRVEFPAAGTYVADVRSDSDIISPELWLGEGEALPARILAPAVQLAAGGVVAGLVLTVVTYRARQRSADRFAERLAAK